MNSIKRFLIVASIGVMASVFAYSIRAYGMDESSWPTQITFDEPVRVGNLSLSAGTYDFYLTSGPATRNVILIYSVSMKRWEGMAMGINDSRQDTSKGSGFTFEDAKNGSPKMLEYWFYPGWNRGIKIIYPEIQTRTMAAAIIQ